MEWKEIYGPWALVTGASSGLGAEFVRQLAAKGLNVVLVARRRERMEVLAARVQEAHRVCTRIVQADLTEDGACGRVVEGTRDLQVGLLVNNAGFGISGAYHTCDPDRQADMVVLNCVVPVLLTSAYLPPMLQRGRGGLIFLASTAAYQPTPYLAAYGATKAFNLMLGESLWEEYRKQGVDSLALSPGFTRTEFSRVANFKGAGPLREATPPAVVALALRSLGRRPSAIHGLANKILNFTSRLVTRKMALHITGTMLKGRSPTP